MTVLSFCRSSPQKLIIRGNEEKYLENLIGKDQTKWTDGQMQFANRYADEVGDHVRPFSVKTSEAAYEAWEHSLNDTA